MPRSAVPGCASGLAGAARAEEAQHAGGLGAPRGAQGSAGAGPAGGMFLTGTRLRRRPQFAHFQKQSWPLHGPTAAAPREGAYLESPSPFDLRFCLTDQVTPWPKPLSP